MFVSYNPQTGKRVAQIDYPSLSAAKASKGGWRNVAIADKDFFNLQGKPKPINLKPVERLNLLLPIWWNSKTRQT